MKRTRMLIAAFATLALLSSCIVESTYPLCDLDGAVLDKGLLGLWSIKEGDASSREGHVLFLDGSNGAMLAFIYGPDMEFEEMYEVYTSEIADQGWLSIRRPSIVDGQYDPDGSSGTFLLGHYSVGETMLTIKIMDIAIISAAIARGELSGTPSDGGLSSALLTDTRESLVRFIEKHPGLEFLGDGELTMHR